MPIILPHAIARMSAWLEKEKRDPKRKFDAANLLVGCPVKPESIPDNMRTSIERLCEVAIPQHENPLSIYARQREKHAYVGTLFLSLLYMGGHNLATIRRRKDAIHAIRKDQPDAWEIVRHVGRPSVPAAVLPVFAVFEAERKAGKPLFPLSARQLEVIFDGQIKHV